jgi:hypothetical protein
MVAEAMRLGCRAGLADVGGGRWAMLDARELADLGRADVLNLARVEEQRPGRVSARTDSFPTTIYIYTYTHITSHHRHRRKHDEIHMSACIPGPRLFPKHLLSCRCFLAAQADKVRLLGLLAFVSTVQRPNETTPNTYTA